MLNICVAGFEVRGGIECTIILRVLWMVIDAKGVFGALSNIQDGAFVNNQWLLEVRKAIDFSYQNAPS